MADEHPPGLHSRILHARKFNFLRKSCHALNLEYMAIKFSLEILHYTKYFKYLNLLFCQTYCCVLHFEILGARQFPFSKLEHICLQLQTGYFFRGVNVI